jgi:hypothetical protein
MTVFDPQRAADAATDFRDGVYGSLAATGTFLAADGVIVGAMHCPWLLIALPAFALAGVGYVATAGLTYLAAVNFILAARKLRGAS